MKNGDDDVGDYGDRLTTVKRQSDHNVGRRPIRRLYHVGCTMSVKNARARDY
jgi:hypothetical protein